MPSILAESSPKIKIITKKMAQISHQSQNTAVSGFENPAIYSTFALPF